MTDLISKLAGDIAADLFINGAAERGVHLRLYDAIGVGEGRYLGGWCEPAVALWVEQALRHAVVQATDLAKLAAVNGGAA